MVRRGLAFFPPADRSARALVIALERWADEVAVGMVKDGRDRLRSALRQVTASIVGVEVAAFSAADTIVERLDARDEPRAGLDLGRLGLLYSPGFALGVAAVVGLQVWAGSLVMLVQMAGRCPL